jgi:hypothetical protein
MSPAQPAAVPAVARKQAAPGAVPSAAWQQVWFAARQRPWTSLVVVPAHAGTSALFVAEALASVGALYGDRPVQLLNAEGERLADVAARLRSLGAIVGRQELVVVAVDAPAAQAASIPIARAVEAAILVVPLGESGFAEARHTMDLVGRDRFVGAVTLALDGKGRV